MDLSHLDYLWKEHCDVFISCLVSLSNGTHSLQRIHLWASYIMLHFSKSFPMKKTNLLEMLFFGVNYSFNCVMGWCTVLQTYTTAHDWSDNLRSYSIRSCEYWQQGRNSPNILRHCIHFACCPQIFSYPISRSVWTTISRPNKAKCEQSRTTWYRWPGGRSWSWEKMLKSTQEKYTKQ